MEFLSEIIEASKRLAGKAHHTPLMHSSTIDKMVGGEVYFKCENFQRMGAFKFRGAYNAISLLSEEEKKKGVITHSSGNHAQAIALASSILGVKSVIVMPRNAPSIKQMATRGYGGEVVLCEPTQKAREETCQQLILEHGYTMIHPYDNFNVICGAGTVAKEITEELDNIDLVITPVGGGGLLSGTSAWCKESGNVKTVYGAEPEGADDAYLSLKEGRPLPQTNPQTIADGLRTSLSEMTFSIIQKYVDGIITVSEREIICAMKLLFERMKIVVEPSGAVPLAALLKGVDSGTIPKGLRSVVILSGGNVDLDVLFKSYQAK